MKSYRVVFLFVGGSLLKLRNGVEAAGRGGISQQATDSESDTPANWLAVFNVFASPGFQNDLGLAKRSKYLTVQEFVTQLVA